MRPASDAVSGPTQRQEQQTNDEHDQPRGPKEAGSEQETEKQEDKSDNDHVPLVPSAGLSQTCMPAPHSMRLCRAWIG